MIPGLDKLCMLKDFLHILRRCDMGNLSLLPENPIWTTGNAISIWLTTCIILLFDISELLYNPNHKGNKNSTQGQVKLTAWQHFSFPCPLAANKSRAKMGLVLGYEKK